jgi:outer membrane protein assembly factor BamB
VWKCQQPKGERVLSGPLIDGDLVMAVGRHGVYGVDLSTGVQAWPSLPRTDGPVSMPAVALAKGHHVLLFSEGSKPSESRLIAYDLSGAAPQLLWNLPLEDVTASGISVEGSTAFLGDRSGNVYAVRVGLRGGSLAWSKPSPAGGIVDAPPAVAGGDVFAVVRDSSSGAVKIVALHESDGKPAWPSPYAPSAPTSFGSAVTVDGGRLYVGFGDQTVRALRTSDGASLWSARLNSPFFPLTASAVSGGTVFVLATFPGAEAGLYRLDAVTGRRDWWFEFDTSTVVSSPVVVGPYLYVALDDGRLAAVQQASDVEVWQRGTGRGGLRPIAVGGGMVVVSKAGSLGGLVAFAHDGAGRLIHVVSPTRLNLGRSLANYAEALAAVLVLVALLRFGTRWIGRRRAAPASTEEPA